MTKYLISKEAQVIERILQNNRVPYKIEYSFSDFRGQKNVPFRYDFAIFDSKNNLKALIEYDSKLHFDKKNKLVNNYKHYRENDLKKNRYALAHKIPLYRIPFWALKTLNSFDSLFQEDFRVKSIWHNYDLANKNGWL